MFPRQTLANKSWYENVWLANGGPTYDPKDLRITEVVSFDTPSFQSSHQSRYIDLRGRHTLFICSSLVNNDAVSVNGLRGVVAKVAVSEAYGGLINFQHGGNPYDLTSLRDTSVRRIRFWIADAFGDVVNLRGGEWSATLIFCRH